MEKTNNLKTLKHHQQSDLCKSRLPYRQGRKLTAVKVYTVASESQHLFIYGVPKINLRSELKTLVTKYGEIKNIHVVNDHETEIFTECFHVQYHRIQSARIAKRFLDNRSFYGSVLHVCYAPEFENLEETKAKLLQRRVDVLRRISPDYVEVERVEKYVEPTRKRKRPALELTEERMAETDPMCVWKNAPKEIDPRQPSNSKSQNEPQKHYQIRNNQEYGPTREDFVKNSFIKPYPESSEMGNDKNKDGFINGQKSNLIPSQIINPKTFVKSKQVIKRIVFRNKVSDEQKS